MSTSMRWSQIKPAQFAIALALFLASALQAQLPASLTLQATQFHDLLSMEQACATLLPYHCTVVIDAPQSIELSSAHTLPANIFLRFRPGGLWTINGASLHIASGLIEAPPTQQIFAGSSKIDRLAVARPEWFNQPTPLGFPAQALARAYRSTVPWGTILLNDAVYLSPFEEAHYDSPRHFIGTTRPELDSEKTPRQLVHGTIIRGSILGIAALQATHLGVDVGPWVVENVLHHKPNGIYLPNPGGFNSRHGTVLADVAVLTNDLDGQHSVLLEGDDGAFVDGLWITSTGGTHGLVFKASHSVIRNYHCRGASGDCLIVKSDYRSNGSGFASADRFENLDFRFLAQPGDTGGITLDARGDAMSAISFTNVTESGLTFGFNGAGSWLHTLTRLTIDHWSARQMQGACAAFHYSADIAIRHFICEQTGSAPFAFDLSSRSTTLSNGEIFCQQNLACHSPSVHGIVDSGRGTTLEDLTSRGLGGYLLAISPSASHSSYSGLRVLDGSGRVMMRLHPPRRSFAAWLSDLRTTVKPQLRILWSTFVTTIVRFFRWIRHRLAHA